MFGRCAIDARSMFEQCAIGTRPLYDKDEDGDDDGDDDVYEHGVTIVMTIINMFLHTVHTRFALVCLLALS